MKQTRYGSVHIKSIELKGGLCRQSWICFFMGSRTAKYLLKRHASIKNSLDLIIQTSAMVYSLYRLLINAERFFCQRL
jgi:hypothetical protein